MSPTTDPITAFAWLFGYLVAVGVVGFVCTAFARHARAAYLATLMMLKDREEKRKRR